jgi:hypothetical protein
LTSTQFFSLAVTSPVTVPDFVSGFSFLSSAVAMQTDNRTADNTSNERVIDMADSKGGGRQNALPIIITQCPATATLSTPVRNHITIGYSKNRERTDP